MRPGVAMAEVGLTVRRGRRPTGMAVAGGGGEEAGLLGRVPGGRLGVRRDFPGRPGGRTTT